ncbi:MAG TPA: hypothetical protein PLL75_02905 [Candidatus Omnitrophota bacterium]|nr:hypothetical protein [Candidatus Omnitrophota bacterium]
MRKIFFFSFFALGFSSLVAQVTVIRELAMSFYGNEFFTGWVLFGWLFWTGTGSFAENISSRTEGASIAALWGCPAVLALLFPSTLCLVRFGKFLLGAPAGAAPDFLSTLGYSFLILAPFCLVLGYQFAAAARCWNFLQPGSGTVVLGGRSYLFETTGFIAGGILFSFALVFAGAFRVAAILAALNLGISCLFFFYFQNKTRLLRRGLVAVTVFLPFWLFMNAGSFEQASAQWRFPNETLVDSENTVHGNLAVTRIGKQYSFYQNGLLAGTGDDRLAAETLVHFPMLLHRKPVRVLLIGTGFNGAFREILKHGPEAVTGVELDPRQVGFAKKYLSSDLAGVLDDKRITIVTEDSRFFLKTHRENFDVVILNVPDPSTVLANRQYTAEFFRKIGEHLAPGGIVATRLMFAANAVTPEQENLAASLYKTLHRSFPEVLVLPEDTLYLIASMAPLVKDPAVLARRMETRGIRNDFVTAEYLKYRLTNDRVSGVAQLLQNNKTAWTNRDLQPRGYYYDFLCWVSSFHPALARGFSASLRVPFILIPGILLSAILLVRVFFRKASLSGAAMAAGGFSLMAAEILLIYAFQVFYGNLYYRIAWIITAFMAGMGAGTWLGNRKSSTDPRTVLGGLHVAVTFYFLLSGGLWWALSRNFFASSGIEEGLFFSGAVLIGALLGFEFPNVLRFREVEGQGARAGKVYAADLFGSCFGALFSAGFFIPAYGVYRTLMLLMMLNASVALLLLAGRARVAGGAKG